MIERGMYIIKDEFFEYIKDLYLKINKNEKRPHYYCFEEERTKLLWMIPLSSKVEKYRKIMNKIITSKNYCDLIHIVKLDNNKESVFLIQDIFPITEKYIDREYTIAGNHLKITAIHSVNEIEKKAKKVIKLIKKWRNFYTYTTKC